MSQLETGSPNRIGYICEKAHTVTIDEPISRIKAFFDRSKPISAVVVMSDHAVVGMVMNIHMNLKLSQRYGFSLFYNKPVSAVMDASPMIVDHFETIEDVARKAMERDPSCLYDHIVVTREGRLHGIVAVRTILNALVDLQKDRSRIQERYTEQLEQSDKEKKEMIQQLKSSQDMLQLVIDSIPHAVFWKDRNSVYLGCNKKFAADAGFSDTRKIKGLTDTDLPWTGSEAGLFTEQDRRVMEADQPELNTHQVQTNSHGQKCFLETSKIPLHDHEGSVVGVLCFYQDITRRLTEYNERIKLEKQLARAQKMEAIGRLAGGVAHDLNNILSGIVNYPELIMMELPETSSLIPSLKTIQKSGERAAAVVQDLLTLARRGVEKKEILDLNTVIRQYLETPEALALKAEYPNIRIEKETGPELLTVEGSRVHLMKIIMNLVNNSVEAIEQNTGVVTIRTYNERSAGTGRREQVGIETDYVVLEVADNGIGISKNDIEKIFEPFYTKKKMGRSGTGLGMAVVWGSVKDLGGFIDISSEENEGTTVKIYLPPKKSRPSLLVDESRYENLMGDGELVLVIDDVAEQREIAARYLKKLNYRVHTLESGELAVEYVRSNPADLLLLDMIMEPGMDGLETYMKILEIYPGQQAIITSGFSESDRVKKAQQLGVGCYLRKPYNFKHLGQAVKTELMRAS